MRKLRLGKVTLAKFQSWSQDLNQSCLPTAIPQPLCPSLVTYLLVKTLVRGH
jgi:hypothetical protein